VWRSLCGEEERRGSDGVRELLLHSLSLRGFVFVANVIWGDFRSKVVVVFVDVCATRLTLKRERERGRGALLYATAAADRLRAHAARRSPLAACRRLHPSSSASRGGKSPSSRNRCRRAWYCSASRLGPAVIPCLF
jgi:hypothetical protein